MKTTQGTFLKLMSETPAKRRAYASYRRNSPETIHFWIWRNTQGW